MDLIDQLSQLAARIPGQMPHLQTEEATKNALVMPLINALGYNVFDPTEVIPEFTADVGTKKGEKVDYVIVRDGQPTILIECKTVGSKLSLEHASQLFRYFSVTAARFAILTDGIRYQFYTDIEAPNKMDEKPFFEFSMLELDGAAVEEIKKFAKAQFDLDGILCNAGELKYKKQIAQAIAKELESPTDDFVKHFFRQVQSGPFTSSAREQFTPLVAAAFREFIKNRVNERIQSALDGSGTAAADADAPSDPAPLPDDDGVVTTDDEVEAFHVVRAILCKFVPAHKIAIRDTKSYCGVLFDDNNRKPLCRFHFNSSQKYLGLFDAEKKEERVAIEAPSDIYRFEDRIVATLQNYVPVEASI